MSANSDDPAYFGGYIGANYRAIAAALDLSNEDLKMLAAMSIRGSWLHEVQKERHLAANRSALGCKHAPIGANA